MSNFFKELKRRNVIKVASVYAVVAWIIIQIGGATFEALNLPSWALTFIIVLLFTGFPIAVIFSWIFDRTPEGKIKIDEQDKDLRPLAKKKRTWFALAGIAAGIVLGVFFARLYSPDTINENGVNNKSIAVLPFTPFTVSEENQEFADGVHDDIVTQLSKVKDLLVISRTSVVQYKNTTKTMGQIAKELNVKNILEGSVRRAGDQIRIVAQLINATTDEHLWSETYDRNYANIFAIQSDVAKKIAAALKATLTPEEKAYIEEQPTENLEAYDFYLRGNNYLRRGNEEEELRIAIQMYTEAVALDPSFALAYANLSQARTNLFWFGGRSQKQLVESKKAVDKALQLKPNLAEAHIALGEYMNKGFQNYQDALENFKQAQQTQPNNSDVFSAIAFVQKRQGQWDKALANYVKAMELDPRSPSKTIETGITYLYMHEYKSAERFINRAIDLAPDNRDYHAYAAWLYLLWQGDKEKAADVLEEASVTVSPEKVISGGNVYFFSRGLWRFNLAGNDYNGILKQLSMDFFRKDRVSYLFSKAQVYGLKGDADTESAYYDTIRVLLEKKIQDQPGAFRSHLQLGYAYANLGLMDQALVAGLKAVELMPISLCHW